MSARPYDLVVVGLSLSSSWGNGHATTFRALLRGMADLGQRVLFLERDVAWYAAHRDLPTPDFCELALYDSVKDLKSRFAPAIAAAPAVIVGSYVPDGIAVLDDVLGLARGVRGFYDIDTPVTLAQLARNDCAYLAARQIPALDLYLSFSGGPALQTLGHRYGARHPLAFHCAVDPDLYAPAGGRPIWDLGYLGTYSADRQPALEKLLLAPARLLPHRRFVVAGPQYPDTIVWPANVERIEHLPPQAHAGFYTAQSLTLNITRADMVAAGYSPSVRLFEAAACGTAIVSDRWAGLTDLFPERQAVWIADSTDDIVALLETQTDATRTQMARRARAIVMADHTGGARAEQLLRHLKQVPAQPCEAAGLSHAEMAQ